MSKINTELFQKNGQYLTVPEYAKAVGISRTAAYKRLLSKNPPPFELFGGGLLMIHKNNVPLKAGND